MDTDDLSNEAYEIIKNAGKINDLLRPMLGVLCTKQKGENEFLNESIKFLNKIINDPEYMIDEFVIEEEEIPQKIKEIKNLIKLAQIVFEIPAVKKTYIAW